ncbi:sulfurtransferase [Microbacterium sp. No. 7]|uniref:sulfurtransferase n=1 Tax=Microbacterium sp. No. 7 TaxID=1714373 RepID=UPI0006D00A14|nr:sulfurtransferase [Microbacterium sp. No. 7]ALJ19138.1 thiosulfate sulfurtransferase [Microbacterium sp. No. 7]
MSHLIDVSELQAALDADRPVRLLDVRWRLDEPEGRLPYLAGHLPGAVFVDLEGELSQRGHPELGRYPLPELADLQTSVHHWGLNPGDLVVAYDDNDSVAAARAWWLLRRRGVDIRVLDGGLRAWIAAGGLVQSGDVVARPGALELTDADPGVIDIHEAAQFPHHGALIDVRSPQHYRGSVPGTDPIAGHIPGAINLPTLSHIAPDGRLRPVETILVNLAAIGVTPGVPVAVYCGAGIASAHSALAFAVAGIDALIYPGSWSQWSRTRGRPVARGRTPDQLVVGS